MHDLSTPSQEHCISARRAAAYRRQRSSNHAYSNPYQVYHVQGTNERPGLMPLVMSSIIAMAENTESIVEISYYEVYMDRCYDLLEPKNKEIPVLEDSEGRVQLRGLAQDMLAAGMETSSSTLEWTMSELLRHPHVLKKLQEEIESTVGKHGKVNGSDVGKIKYLQCVVKETLRLHPPLPLLLPHESVEAATVCGYNIPKKTTVMVNVWAIGRDPDVWGQDALDFKPERFMHELGGHDNIMDFVSSQSDFRMLPFSAGRRGCPGAAMAIPMIELALAQLLQLFDWSVDGHPSELDMTEEGGTSLSRKLPLFAFPKLGEDL